MEKKFNFEEEMKIDLDDLQEEWKNHASFRYKYAAEVSHLDKVCKQKKLSIGLKKSAVTDELSRFILQAKERFPKYTMQQIEAVVAGLSEDSSAKKELSFLQNELISDEYDLSMAKNAVQAFDDRKTALENEVKLWLADYFSVPVEKKQIDPKKSIGAKNKDENTKAVRAAMNKKKKKK